ncbi:MAG TPA: hypothetical protein VF516_28995 [Kofleriaceae bacterium]
MRIRPVLAITCCLLGAGSLLLEAHNTTHGDGPLMTGMAVIVVVAAALLALRPLWAALAGRGLLWTVLALTTLIDSISHPIWTATAAALAMCAALLALGRHALEGPTAAFRPNHHRGLLTLAMVLGFADVATLSTWSIFAFASGDGRALLFGLVFTAIAAAIAASLVGLYRLYAWGFLLNLAVNLAVTVLMMFDVFRFDVFRLVFIVPAAAQILLALPVLVAILLRRPLTVPRPLARLGALVPALTVLVMAGLNVQSWFGEPALRQLVRWGMGHL